MQVVCWARNGVSNDTWPSFRSACTLMRTSWLLDKPGTNIHCQVLGLWLSGWLTHQTSLARRVSPSYLQQSDCTLCMSWCQISKAIQAWLPTPAAQGICILYGCGKRNPPTKLNTVLEQIIEILAASHDSPAMVLQHCQADVGVGP